MGAKTRQSQTWHSHCGQKWIYARAAGKLTVIRRRHLNHCHAHAPAVGTPPVPLLPNHLGRHPERRPPQRRRVVLLRNRPSQLSRSSKISNLETAVCCHEDICTLDISVHHCVRVYVRDTLVALSRVLPQHRLIKRTKRLQECAHTSTLRMPGS